MAKLEDQSNKHEWCLLRTQVQPNSGWGALCEDCEHAEPRLIDNSIMVANSDFPCKKWGTKHPPPPNLLRYSYPLKGVVDDVINMKEVKVTDMLGVDFVELCLAYVRRDDPL